MCCLAGGRAACQAALSSEERPAWRGRSPVVHWCQAMIALLPRCVPAAATPRTPVKAKLGFLSRLAEHTPAGTRHRIMATKATASRWAVLSAHAPYLKLYTLLWHRLRQECCAYGGLLRARRAAHAQHVSRHRASTAAGNQAGPPRRATSAHASKYGGGDAGAHLVVKELALHEAQH